MISVLDKKYMYSLLPQMPNKMPDEKVPLVLTKRNAVLQLRGNN